MTITTTYAWPAALLTLLATSCAPTYYTSLTPARPTNLFVEGRAQARAATADSVEVRLSFVRYEGPRMVFEAVYRNPTTHPLLVAPTEFTYQLGRAAAPLALAAAQPKGRPARPRPAAGAQVNAVVAAASAWLPLPPLPTRPVAALDPEPEIESLRTQAERAEAKANRIDWLGIALAVSSVAVEVASVTDSKPDTPAKAENRAEFHDAVATYQMASAANKIGHAVAAEAMQLRALSLQDYALRKVTLEPGQQVRGLLYFPRFDAADTVRILAPVPGGVLPLEFVQTHTRR